MVFPPCSSAAPVVLMSWTHCTECPNQQVRTMMLSRKAIVRWSVRQSVVRPVSERPSTSLRPSRGLRPLFARALQQPGRQAGAPPPPPDIWGNVKCSSSRDRHEILKFSPEVAQCESVLKGDACPLCRRARFVLCCSPPPRLTPVE